MKLIPTIGLASLLLTLAYCKSTKSGAASPSSEPAKTPATFVPSDKQVQIAQTRWPNTTAPELSEGQSIYANNCNKCHELFEITRFGEKKWIHEIADMAPKAELNKEQTAKLTKYILSYREANAVQKPN